MVNEMPRVTPSALNAQRLELSYEGSGTTTRALRGVDFSVGVGGPEAVAVMGPSGSGKSSLLHVLAGILRPNAGTVHWRGEDIATMKDAQRTRLRRTDFGFVFQSGQLLPELSASENVMIPLLLAKTGRPAAQRRANGMLAALGLGGMFDKRPGQLSGGQAQRVAIARALVTGPGLVFADEPTGALDRTTGASVLQLLIQQTLSRGASLVVVTHDPEVARVCSRTVYLEDGIVVDSTASQPAAHAQQQQYPQAPVQSANPAQQVPNPAQYAQHPSAHRPAVQNPMSYPAPAAGSGEVR
ncbi:MAG TPA: ABC transporter ATP-binding protein [Candidatus Agrococcus pullicola]|uniref:ABC transporter ATP-binding protein n=1 Tax=Candidatus Agrococcus pullicola TaxID=2838429 RepID=A0A9D1YTX2_9MICO|nr:ABC transporter ATP-binding protein [Candidatus Agrococcus pullicola]